jgi:hypothetical protein
MATRLPYARNRWYGGMSRYSESAFASGADCEAFDAQDWGSWEKRQVRYSVLWAFFENNSYLNVHAWAESRKSRRDLYPYIRSIASLANRAGNFWGTHLLGGQLDPAAGDGKCRPSALPIVIEKGEEGEDSTAAQDEAESERSKLLRASLARLWKDSVWQRNKDTFALKTAVLGDGFLMAVDDPFKSRVCIKSIDPSTVREVSLDYLGNVRRYVIVEQRPDPEHTDPLTIAPLVDYVEIAEKRGESVVFTTYRDDDDTPYDWRDYPDGIPERQKIGGQWTEEYPCVPLVKVQFINVGQPWGWGICYPDLGKLDEIDDLASNVGDYIRICKDSPYLITGVKPDGQEADTTGDEEVGHIDVEFPEDSTSDRSAARLANVLLKTPNPASRAFSLVATLDIDHATKHLQLIIDQFKEDHPELQGDPATASGSGSGRALRVYREKAERLTNDRRSAFDEAQKRIFQIALTMGGIKGYEGYEWIDSGSYDRGDLDFSIGERPVFAADEADKIELEKERANALKTYIDSGLPLPIAMKMVGFSDDQIEDASEAKEEEESKALTRLRESQRARFADDPQADQGDGDEGEDGGDGGTPPSSGPPMSNGVAVALNGDGRYGEQ